jgi:hypothetical protein
MTRPKTDWPPPGNINRSPTPAPAQKTKPVPRALHLYLRVVTETGRFKGGITRKSWGNDWFELVSVILQPDETVEVVKSFDSGSVAFVLAQARGDLLPAVEIELADEYDRVKKRVALISAIITSDWKVTTSGTTAERIAFKYKTIDYLWTSRNELRSGWTVVPR